MRHFEGIETVDPTALEKQRILTHALWHELVDQGVGPGTEGKIECFLYGTTKLAALAMADHYRRLRTWGAVVDESPDSRRTELRITTPCVRYSLEAFLELTDVMMIDARRFGLDFDGLHVDLAGTKRTSWLVRLLRTFFGHG